MTERYVDGINGNNAWDGLAPNFVSGTNGPKATLNGAEDTPVVAGDLTHVRPTTYRELHTIGVSGTAGNAIEFRGDYNGLIWPNPTNAVVRITGSDNDQVATRTSCISATGKNYRTFQGFVTDLTTSQSVLCQSACTNWIVQNCILSGATTYALEFQGAGGSHTVNNCMFIETKSRGLNFWAASAFDNSANTVSNCIFVGMLQGVSTDRVGGITVRNCKVIGCNVGIRVQTALTVGQTLTVNNGIVCSNVTGFQATTLGELIENYNDVFANNTDRINVSTGANSLAYAPLLDARWFFELVSGLGRMLSPFDLASYSQLINVAGTSPTTTDMRGTAVIGAQREWGALEYDPALLFRRVIARQA